VRVPAFVPLAAIAVLAVLAALSGCGGASRRATAPPPSLPARTYEMGFSAFPPRLTEASLIANFNVWSLRSDAAILHVTPEWGALLAGYDPDTIVRAVHLPLADLYRSRGLAITVTLDATDGLDRAAEAPALRDLGRSLAEPAIQQLYREYAVAMWNHLRPGHIALAAEVNLIRAAAPPAVYVAVRQVANDAVADLRAAGCTAKLSVSIQNEVVWGGLGGSGYVGLATDLADFPFMEELLISSYPYLGGYAVPEDVPLDYFSRPGTEAGLPVRIVEGGWASTPVPGVDSSPEEQARYVRRLVALLDSARAEAVFQLNFADFDLDSFPGPVPPNLPLFVTIGFVTEDLVPKPALAAWDSAFARPRVAPGPTPMGTFGRR
jgi:hypothetical protein